MYLFTQPLAYDGSEWSVIVLLASLTLLASIILKDMSQASKGVRAKRLASALDLVILPLLITFLISATLLISRFLA